MFLDEPTTGLDSQSAFSIVRFLRKLCDVGQAIICTIHQPSSDLIEQFDMILAMNPGGRTFYFGPVGENGSQVVDYFAARGFQCAPNQNVAEFILETAAQPLDNGDKSGLNWNKEWRHSNEAKAVFEDINRYKAAKTTAATSDREQTKFTAPTWYQCVLLTKRIFIKNWREPSYVYSRLFVHVVLGITNGFVSPSPETRPARRFFPTCLKLHAIQRFQAYLRHTDFLGPVKYRLFPPKPHVHQSGPRLLRIPHGRQQ